MTSSKIRMNIAQTNSIVLFKVPSEKGESLLILMLDEKNMDYYLISAKSNLSPDYLSEKYWEFCSSWCCNTAFHANLEGVKVFWLYCKEISIMRYLSTTIICHLHHGIKFGI